MTPICRTPLATAGDLRLDLITNLSGHHAWEVRQVLPPPSPRRRRGQEVQRGLGMYWQDRAAAEAAGRAKLAEIAAADRQRRGA